MRLEPDQVKAIKSVLRQYLNVSYELYLYGSRTQDDLKGGDIDLLVITDATGVQLFSNKKLDILVDIKKQPTVGQRKIDIKAATDQLIQTEHFLKHIWPSCVKL